MIWSRGKLLADDALTVPVIDRTFEHGQGLFETLRTWGGRATLLERHLARLTASAEALKLPLDPAALPRHEDVDTLLRANRHRGDALLRITLSGGTERPSSSVLWMRCAPLPPEAPAGGIATVACPFPVAADDPLLGHKSLNYWRLGLLYRRARDQGADEALLVGQDGCFLEGTRTNVFAFTADGWLLTPETGRCLVPGIFRGVVLEFARRLGLAIRHEAIDLPDRQAARGRRAPITELFLTNAVRGIIPVREVRDLATWNDAPGPTTRRLREEIGGWLERGGTPPGR